MGRARRRHDQGGERNGDNYPDWTHPEAGFGENYKITELQAAVALVQCGRLQTIRSLMQKVRADIVERLGPLQITLRTSHDPTGAIPYSILMFASDPQQKSALFGSLAAAGVPADEAYAEPVYSLAPFARWSRGDAVDGLPGFDLPAPNFEPCPRSERLLREIVRVPLSPLYGRTEVERICSAIAAVSKEQAA